METTLFTSKSKIDERTETYRIDGGNAEQQHEYSHHPRHDSAGYGVLLLIVDGILHLFPEGEQSDERKHQGNDEHGVELCVGLDAKGAEVESEQPRNEGKSLSQVLNAEDSPTHHRDDEGDDDARHLTDFFIEFLQTHPFEHQPQAMIRAPDHEIP